MRFKFLLPIFLFCVSSTNVLGMKDTTNLIIEELSNGFRWNCNFEINRLQEYVISSYSNKKLSDSDVKIICNLRNVLAKKLKKEPSEVSLVHVFDAIMDCLKFDLGQHFVLDKEISNSLMRLIDFELELENVTCPLCYANNYTKYIENMDKLCETHDTFFKQVLNVLKNHLLKFQTPVKCHSHHEFDTPKKSKKYSEVGSIQGRNLFPDPKKK